MFNKRAVTDPLQVDVLIFSLGTLYIPTWQHVAQVIQIACLPHNNINCTESMSQITHLTVLLKKSKILLITPIFTTTALAPIQSKSSLARGKRGTELV